MESPSTDVFSGAAFDVLTDDQRVILRLYFQDRWTLFRIASLLRVSLRTVKNYKAAALEALQSTPREMYDAVEMVDGRWRCKVSIVRGDVINATDTTLADAAAVMTSPAYREAFYAQDSTPQEVEAMRKAAQQKKIGALLTELYYTFDCRFCSNHSAATRSAATTSIRSSSLSTSPFSSVDSPPSRFCISSLDIRD